MISTLTRVSSRLIRPLLLVVVPAAAVLIALYMYARGGREVDTENAYVKANVVAVSSEVSGRVAEVSVRDNQPVAAGAPPFCLGPRPFELAGAQNGAPKEEGRADVETLRAANCSPLQGGIQ